MDNREFVSYKERALTAAFELQYSRDIQERIKNARRENEICLALATGRQSIKDDLPTQWVRS